MASRTGNKKFHNHCEPCKNFHLEVQLNGLSDEEIEKTRNKVLKHLERLGYKVINTCSPTTIAKLIKTMRTAESLTQSELAEEIEIYKKLP